MMFVGKRNVSLSDQLIYDDREISAPQRQRLVRLFFDSLL